MSYRKLLDRLNELVGIDTRISLDDEASPRELRFFRDDRLSDDLLRDALERATTEFPAEMSAIADVFVAFRDGLGETRRRVVP